MSGARNRRDICGEKIITINFYTLAYFKFFIEWLLENVLGHYLTLPVVVVIESSNLCIFIMLLNTK